MQRAGFKSWTAPASRDDVTSFFRLERFLHESLSEIPGTFVQNVVF